MKTCVFIVLSIFYWTGAAFAQAPADSSKTSQTPPEFYHFKLKDLPKDFKLEWQNPDKNSLEALNQLTKPRASTAENETPFYSNMPMATFKGKSDPMPSAKTEDGSVHHHLLKKRYKVLPPPTEQEPIVK